MVVKWVFLLVPIVTRNDDVYFSRFRLWRDQVRPKSASNLEAIAQKVTPTLQ